MTPAAAKLRDPDLLNAGKALRRASLRAREIAQQTGTACYVWKDGRVVDIAANGVRTGSKSVTASVR